MPKNDNRSHFPRLFLLGQKTFPSQLEDSTDFSFSLWALL